MRSLAKTWHLRPPDVALDESPVWWVHFDHSPTSSCSGPPCTLTWWTPSDQNGSSLLGKLLVLGYPNLEKSPCGCGNRSMLDTQKKDGFNMKMSQICGHQRGSMFWTVHGSLSFSAFTWPGMSVSPTYGKNNDTISYPLLYIPLHPILFSHDFNPRYFLAWNFPSFPTSPPDFLCSTLARSFLVSHHRGRQATLPSRRLEGRLWRWVLPEKEHASNILQNNDIIYIYIQIHILQIYIYIHIYTYRFYIYVYI